MKKVHNIIKEWGGVFFCCVLILYTFRDTPVVSSASETIVDFYHTALYSGSESNRVRIPKNQMQKIHLSYCRFETVRLFPENRLQSLLIAKMHNSSDWIISSVDVKITNEEFGWERVFRVFPSNRRNIYDDSVNIQRVLIGPNQSFESLAFIDNNYLQGCSFLVCNAFGYKD